MDPATAFALAAAAIAEMITELANGQTPEQKAQLWTWYIEDVKFWRELFKPKP